MLEMNSNPSENDLQSATTIFFAITNRETQKLDFTRLSKLLKTLEKRPDKGFGTLVLTFDGYDDIPDEIYEIKAIRDWVHQLFIKFPYILYFIDETAEGFSVLLPCLGDVEAVHSSERHSPEEFIRRGINPLTDVPKVNVVIKLNNSMNIKIISGLKHYGKRIKDIERTQAVIDLFKVMVNYGKPDK